MKRQSIGWFGRSLLAAVFGLAASAGAAGATTLILSDTSVPAGGTFTITIVDPSLDPALLGVDVNISFDPAQLSFNSNAATVGSWLPHALLTASTFGDPGSSLPPGSASVSICCDFSGGNGSSLFSVAFDVIGAATPQTSIFFATADIAVGLPVEYQIDPSPLSADVQVTAVTAVPEPGTTVLFLTGITALALFGRRRMRHAAS